MTALSRRGRAELLRNLAHAVGAVAFVPTSVRNSGVTHRPTGGPDPILSPTTRSRTTES
ncbi:hypothetical protein QE416_001291 [Microbacterium sp. SORGH_AS 421]|nr:hypothetical protein [Microbacterium sp. SORGH_AS_0421]